MKRFLILIIVALLLFSIAGCKEETTTKKTTTTSGSEAASEETSGEVSEEGSAEASAETESGGIVSDFKDFVTKKTALKYMVSYDVTAKGEGKTSEYAMTQYFGGAGKIRMDTKMPEVESRIYMADNVFTSCTNQQGKWNCFKMAQQESNPTDSVKGIEEHPDDYNIFSDGTKTIAGTVAKCYRITTPQGDVKECFSKEGVPLYMMTKSSGFEFTMEATTYKTSVSNSDFTPPAAAIDMEDYVKQMQAQMPAGYQTE